MKIILASASPYRQALLRKVLDDFAICPADIDESCQPEEDIADYVSRLALGKARKVAQTHPHALIIGSDQACALEDGPIMGKPGDHAGALRQLQQCAGRWLHFHTGLVLLDAQSGEHQLMVDTFSVHFRDLSIEEIEAYLYKEKPYNCAGSFKAEGAGICLFQEMAGRDFNALIGLPLIALVDMLRETGLNPLSPAH